MSLIPLYTKEQIQARIDAVELLKTDYFKEDILLELAKFRVKSQEEAQANVNREEPLGYACGCMGGPSGCSMCNCALVHQSYAYRFHLYMHYFYK